MERSSKSGGAGLRLAYFDGPSGVSGDMLLGALVDAGLELEQLRAELARLPLSGYTLTAQEVRRGGLRGTQVRVEVTGPAEARHLPQIEAIIASSDLPSEVREHSLTVFRRLAQAEAHVHGVPVDEVHFHEVGAVDAIVDVVGTVAGLHLLGVERVFAAPLRVGYGTVACAHGLLPVPAPATLELLRGVPVCGGEVEAELVTPTGAALISTLAASFGGAPPMRVERIGYGAGSRDLPIPNLLRVTIGMATAMEPDEEDAVVVIETNIDDMNPQWYEHVTERLFAAGALDVFLTSVQMKRGRPGVLLTAVLPDEQVDEALTVLFTETTTLGARLHAARRRKLSRERLVVETPYGSLGVKVARRGGVVVNLAPEYREVRQAAQAHGVPLKEVHQAALEAARAQLGL
jgi:uncharacterized protein (TIGR00299 family) protein